MAVNALGATYRGLATLAVMLAALVLTACAPATPTVRRVVLLAPFEGAYREIGYDMLYPLRLALADIAPHGIELLALDSGPDADSAALHAQALAADPTVMLALVAGAETVDRRVLAAFDDVPVIVIGHWGATPDEKTFVMAAADLPDRLPSAETDLYRVSDQTGPRVGGETYGLKAFAALSADTDSVTVITSAAPPSEAFSARLLQSDLYVPTAGLLSTLAYDAGLLAAHALGSSRQDVLRALALQGEGVEGLNGLLRFDASGYLADAPIYTYGYENGQLTPKP